MNRIPKTKKIAILGASESGVGAALLAQQQGYEVFVSSLHTISDDYKRELERFNIAYEEDRHSTSVLKNYPYIIKSPGISNKTEIIRWLKQNTTSQIMAEIEFAALFTASKLIGITGTNGKTTSALLTRHILKSAGKRVVIAGNIGLSFSRALVEKEPADYYVLELSSFQLEDISTFKVNIAVILNVSEDHLDVHASLEEYAQCKLNITRTQELNDALIYNDDDPVLKRFIQSTKLAASLYPISTNETAEFSQGAWIDGDKMVIKLGQSGEYLDISQFAVHGRHNMYNCMAASIATKLCDITSDVLKQSLATFKNASHRLEEVLKVRKVRFINDSKATNINATWYALETIPEPIILLLGGVDKGNNYELIKPLVRQKVKKIICLTADPIQRERLHASLQDCAEIIDAASMQGAVRLAYKLASPNDVVLLSPACASFDLFKSYEDRGDQFKEAVRKL